jgi:hypothetical protein
MKYKVGDIVCDVRYDVYYLIVHAYPEIHEYEIVSLSMSETYHIHITRHVSPLLSHITLITDILSD